MRPKQTDRHKRQNHIIEKPANPQKNPITPTGQVKSENVFYDFIKNQKK